MLQDRCTRLYADGKAFIPFSEGIKSNSDGIIGEPVQRFTLYESTGLAHNEVLRLNKKHILISVVEREIEVSYHETYKMAFEQMVKELDETGNRDGYNDQTYGLEEHYAWSNMNDDCLCDWLIIGVVIKE